MNASLLGTSPGSQSIALPPCGALEPPTSEAISIIPTTASTRRHTPALPQPMPQLYLTEYYPFHYHAIIAIMMTRSYQLQIPPVLITS